MASSIKITLLNQEAKAFGIVGVEPLIFNRMSEKARRTLLLPAQVRGRAARSGLKHEPLTEYRASVYRQRSDDGETRLEFPAPGFKGAMVTAASVVAEATKEVIKQMTWCPGYRVSIYGVPQLLMSVVRSADVKKTPDIRTRAILPRWCCVVTVSYVTPRLNETIIANLLANGGIISGVGDWRQEKGSGNYGQYRLANIDDDAALSEIMDSGGRLPQDRALAAPAFFDEDSEELFGWFYEELDRRGQSSDAAKLATDAVAEEAAESGEFPLGIEDNDGNLVEVVPKRRRAAKTTSVRKRSNGGAHA